jgi:hypothetical protein
MAHVVQLTGFSGKTRRALSRYYAGLPAAGRIEIHRRQLDLIRRHRKKKISGKEPEFFHAMLLLALHRMYVVEKTDQPHRKGSRSSEKMREAHRIRKMRIQAQHKRKPAVVKGKVKALLEVIRELRNRGDSWREASKYLAGMHRFKISPDYLKRCFDQIVTEQKAGGA